MLLRPVDSSGVQHFTKRNKKWTHWAIPRGLYGAERGVQATVRPVLESASARSTDVELQNCPCRSESGTSARPTLRLGAKGDAVREMQEKLMQAGESLPRWGADGDFGSETLAAVRSFQRKHQLVVDGICGPKTWAKLG